MGLKSQARRRYHASDTLLPQVRQNKKAEKTGDIAHAPRVD
jgi:hypothetical protein